MTACVGVWGMRVLASAEERDEGMRVGIYDEVRFERAECSTAGCSSGLSW
jgi:hypothetical protein